MLNDKKKAVIGDLLYRAYMIDAITDEEVKQVCAMFEIKYPPALLENQNEANRGSTCEGTKGIWPSTQNAYQSSIQDKVREPFCVH